MVRRIVSVLALFTAAGFFWYGVWAFCYHALHLDVVQSWLMLALVLIGVLWFAVQQIQEADNQAPPPKRGLRP